MSATLKIFLAGQPWFGLLTDAQRYHVLTESYERDAVPGGYVCRAGEPAEQWIGVISGLVKASVMTADGKTTSYAGIAPGGWLGEGSVLNGLRRRFDVIALRDTTVAMVPRPAFMRLYEENIGFCHYLIDQLNKRLAQQMAVIEIDRLAAPEVRVARFILMLADSQGRLDPRPMLEVSQMEIAQLCGLSRQFTNRMVSRLADLGLVEHRYGRLTITDRAGLQAFGSNDGREGFAG